MENNLKKFRNGQHLSLRLLSEKLSSEGIKISADLLSKYERGERTPSLYTWNKLAKFYNVSVRSLTNQGDYIVDEIDESNDISKKMEELLYRNTIQILLSEVIVDNKTSLETKHQDESLEHLAANLTTSELNYYNDFLKKCLLLIIKSQNDDDALTIVKKLNQYFQDSFSN